MTSELDSVWGTAIKNMKNQNVKYMQRQSKQRSTNIIIIIILPSVGVPEGVQKLWIAKQLRVRYSVRAVCRHFHFLPFSLVIPIPSRSLANGNQYKTHTINITWKSKHKSTHIIHRIIIQIKDYSSDSTKNCWVTLTDDLRSRPNLYYRPHSVRQIRNCGVFILSIFLQAISVFVLIPVKLA